VVPSADFALLANLPADPGLVPNEILAGALPTGPAEVTLDDRTAAEYGPQPPGTRSRCSSRMASGGEVPREVTITGIVQASADPGQAMTVQLRGRRGPGPRGGRGLRRRRPRPGLTPPRPRPQCLPDRASRPPSTRPRTRHVRPHPDDAAHERLEGGDRAVARRGTGSFAAIALLVTGLVIANTFTCWWLSAP
jgi:hypothetical protein